MTGSDRLRALFVSPMDYGANPSVDAIAQGLAHRLSEAGIEPHVAFADFRAADFGEAAVTEAVESAIAHGVDAIGLYCLGSDPLRGAAEAADRAGVPVLTLERPDFPVDASVPFANFQHGMFMVDYLSQLLGPGARVAVIGGPRISDDDELLAGYLYAFERSHLELINDPTSDRHRNLTDVIPGGREAALRLLEDLPEPMDGLIAYNDETMLGTLHALEEVGRIGEMAVISRNGAPEAVRQVLAGRTQGTWDTDPPGLGFALADLLIRRLESGSPLGGVSVMGPVGRMIDPAAAAKWVTFTDRIPYRDLTNGLQ